MGKQGKSSATSATRKKHQKKALDPSISIAPAAKSQGKGKGKGKNKEPRVKQYIPPPKFRPLVEDPIDGLATTGVLPVNLVLCFKGLSKKDPVTKIKALEELGSFLGDESWPAALPVWLWHFVPLSIHPSRRIRELNAIFHSKLVSQPGIQDELRAFIERDSSAESVLAAWMLGANDVVTTVATSLRSSWNSNILWREESLDAELISIQDHLDEIVASVIQAVTEPEALYQQFSPLAQLPKDGIDSLEAVHSGERLHDLIARIRTSGLSVLGWILEPPSTVALPTAIPALSNLLAANPLLGTILSPVTQTSFQLASTSGTDLDAIISFGAAQRSVRIAGWSIVKAVVKFLQRNEPSKDAVGVTTQPSADVQESLKSSFLANLGVAALRSAWIEPDPGVRTSMWEGFLTLIKNNPEVWDITPLVPHQPESDDLDSNDEEDRTIAPAKAAAAMVPSGQAAYTEFLSFLEAGCHGSPVQSYPAVVIVLSTLPSTILPYNHESLENLFASFWAAYAGNTLNAPSRDREPTYKSFLSAYLECVHFVCKRLHQPNSDGRLTDEPLGETLSESIATAWIGKVLVEAIRGGFAGKISDNIVGILVGNSMKKLEQMNPDIINRAWASTWDLIVRNEDAQPRVADSIEFLASMLPSVLGAEISERRIQAILEQKAQLDPSGADNPEALHHQARVLSNLWEHLDMSNAPWLFEVTDKAISHGIIRSLVSSGNSGDLVRLLNGFLGASSASPETHSSTWSALLDTVVEYSAWNMLRNILELVRPALPRSINHSKLFDVSKSWASAITQGNNEHSQDIASVLIHWDVCLEGQQVNELLETITTSFVREAQGLAYAPDLSPTVQILESTVSVILAVLKAKNAKFLLESSRLDHVELGAWLIILPVLATALSQQLLGLSLRCGEGRNYWLACTSSDIHTSAKAAAQTRVTNLLTSHETPLSVSDVLEIAVNSGLYANEKAILLQLLPEISTFDNELEDLNDNPSSLLAEADPLVSPHQRDPSSVSLLTYDHEGLSRYARLGAALTGVLSQSRHLAKEYLWTFRHLLMLQQLGFDFLAAPFWPSHAFARGSTNKVKSTLGKVTPILIYLGNSLLDELGHDWHRTLIERLYQPTAASSTPQNAQDIVYEVYSYASRSSARLRDVRLLRRLMQMVLRDAGPNTLDIWVDFAHSAQNNHPQIAQALGSVVASRGVESARLDRWRNEMASRISGISPRSANLSGLPLLRALNCLAPPVDSGIVFLPQQRAVFLIQAVQKWMTSDEDLDENLETHVTVTCYHLLPILQTVPGAHWEFILDILENNLEVADGASSANLYLLLHTLRAILSVSELARTNQTLNDIWKPRQDNVFECVLRLFLAETDSLDMSDTRDKYQICLVDAMQTLPSRQISANLFSQLFSQASSRHVPIKATAHQLARNALAQITEQRVLEAAVSTTPEDADVEGEPGDIEQFKIPEPVIQSLGTLSGGELDLEEHQLNLLLSWWIALEFFDNSSLKIKQGYLEQLRGLDLVKGSLLPCLFELLRIGIATEKPFSLSQWYVEEYYFDLYDGSLPSTLNVLAAHIYFKALKAIPGLIRNWWTECQDKQLSSTLSAYTKSHFSPVLIKQELAQFRSSVAAASDPLTDEQFVIKVAPNVNEISAVYTIDDQTLEVAVRLPPEFPLRAAEVRDVRGIGGMENRIRAWVFGVRQTAQQGLIYDALAVYKKNVVGHFEGKSECAICYSLISVTDRTLPTKPCRTCKNRFHSSCLYKWFNTSHSSTCPLCRSDIV
ncbi:hypothetical protein BDV93DRAFT_521494 [Ceratobasidium sp. AG-I]|nr:hypothetical protein BDV93DRAFT_521494 [Ceratobasidium sp. AG-I]